MNRPTDDELRERLREGDPASDGSEPSPDEWTAMRRRVLHAALQPRKARTGMGVRGWAWSAAAAAAIVALLVGREIMDLGERGTGSPTVAEGGAETTPTGAPAPPSEGDRRPRTLQFTTGSGIRVIWTLDPGFELPAALLAVDSGDDRDHHPPGGQGS